MTQSLILVIDDDQEMRVSLTHLLERGGYRVQAVKDGAAGLAELDRARPDAVLCDMRMPGMDGMEFQRRAAAASPVPIVLFSAHADIPMAVEAIQNGAYSFLEKPFDPRRLLTLLGNAVRLKRVQDNAARLEARLTQLTDLEQLLIGESPGLRAVRQQIYDYADVSANVLVIGRTGTGKELVAQALHDLGPGPAAPMVAVNCAAIPEERFEETVFGSAEAPNGLMQRANGGTLFLDELASMPFAMQAKFLRAVETKTCEPVGMGAPVSLELRIVSAVSGDPRAAVEAGHLRKDLLFRLNTLMVELPGLTDRGEDVMLLFRHYLKRFATLYNVPEPALSNSDYSALLAHNWPGNVRELQSVAERRVLAAKRGGGSVAASIEPDAHAPEFPQTLREAVAVFERQIITRAIREQGGRMNDAADHLGIGRRTLNEKVVKLGIDRMDILQTPQ